jgi:hypothetical protein
VVEMHRHGRWPGMCSESMAGEISRVILASLGAR